MMSRFVFASVFLSAAWLGGCAEPAEAPEVDELANPAIERATELASDGAEPLDEVAESFEFTVAGEAGPSASYALEDDAECFVYDAHVVRLTPVEGGDGHTIDLIARPDDASPFALCSAEGEVELPTRAGVDTFVALDGTVLWTVRDSRGRDFLTGYDVATEEPIFEETVTAPVEKDDTGLTYGGPLESMTSMEALEAAGVTCPEAAAWFAEDRPVAISRRLRYSFETSETADAGEALCLVQDDA